MSNPFSNTYYIGHPERSSTFAKCPECNRVFLLDDEVESQEYYYGHDCEPQEEKE